MLVPSLKRYYHRVKQCQAAFVYWKLADHFEAAWNGWTIIFDFPGICVRLDARWGEMWNSSRADGLRWRAAPTGVM